MQGKFIVNNSTSLNIIDITKKKILCSFQSLLNYRIIGDAEQPEALDPSGGPLIGIGFHINDYELSHIWWDKDRKQYLLMFDRK